MTKKRVILVTGVASYWGSQVATRLVSEVGLRYGEALAGDTGFHIIGLDNEPPDPEIEGLDFIQADVRNPLLIELFKSEQVHTVCHLGFVESVRPSETAFDINVIGTMKVLGACAEARVRKAILMSSTEVYGAHPNNPAFITEQHPLQGDRTYGSIRDRVEIEAFCNGFRRQVPEMMLTILRFTSIIGPTADTAMTRFLREPWTPVLMGFDPLMQVIHESDVVDALVYAILNDTSGVFNVAAEGVLPLRRLIGLAGKIPVPVFHLFVYWGKDLLGAAGVKTSRYLPIPADSLRYPWIADLKQMREDLGFSPHYTAEEALREFAGQQRLQQYMPESAALAYDEGRLRDTIERRRRIRENMISTALEVVEEGENE